MSALRSNKLAALLWFALVLALGIVIAILLPITPNDYWWYLRLGKDILANNAIPTIDTFTYSQANTPVAYHSWGSAVLFYLVYKLGGLPLTVLLRAVLVSLAGLFLWLISRRMNRGRLGPALVLLLWVLAASNNWSMRPQLFAYPLFALSLWLLYKWQDGCKKCIYWLPLISLLWVNLHGSFVMLVILVGAALIFPPGNQATSRKSLLLVLAGILLATFINPRGLGAWTYIFTSITVPSSQLFSAEWLPPINNNWQMNIFFAWLLLFPLLAAASLRKPSRLEWTWFLIFGFFALWGERYVIWFVFILAILSAGLISDWENKIISSPKPGLPMVNFILAAIFLLLPFVLLPGVRETWWKKAPAVTENTPITATQWLANKEELAGPLWSEIGFSSYLEYSLPERPTWIDTRFEVFPVVQWQAYKDVTNAAYNWQDLLDATDANLLMVSNSNQPKLITALGKSSIWCEIYSDDVAVIFQRCGEKE
jgi:hypothetical protein